MAIDNVLAQEIETEITEEGFEELTFELEEEEMEEELELESKPMTKAEHIKDQMERYHSDNPVVRNNAIVELMDEHAPLISAMINKHFASFKASYFEDMYSAGKVGLLTALSLYDPEKSKPSTFFAIYIKHEIYEFITRYIYHLSPYHAFSLFKLIRKSQELEIANGREPDKYELAVHLNISLKEVEKLLSMRNFGNMQFYDSEQTLDGLVNGYSQSPEEIYLENENTEYLYSALNILSDKEREVICRKFGILGYPKQTHVQMAAEAGVAADRIRSLYTTAMRKLRQSLRQKASVRDCVGSLEREVSRNTVAVTPKNAALEQANALIDDNEVEIELL